MLSNLHTHSLFCDGNNTLEEVTLSAIQKGFQSLGFSGHGYTDFDLTYCMKETPRYIAEVNHLKQKYKDKIQIYLGVEEDGRYLLNRKDFDYIIGSFHYSLVGGKYYPIDLGVEGLKDIIEAFGGDIIALSEEYYSSFCDYILSRKPDIVGHFDLITKFDEVGEHFFSGKEEYEKVAAKYMEKALESGCLFEVNTGAISRGYRKSPYPSENLLHIIKKNKGKIILSSDCHSADAIDCQFENTRKWLKDIGFEYVYALYNNEFVKDYL